MEKELENVTVRTLAGMSDEEINILRRGLGKYIDTPYRKQARIINGMCGDELNSRKWGKYRS